MRIPFAESYKETGSEKIDVKNPVTGEIVDSVPALKREDIDTAVAAAAEGQKDWASRTQMERNRILRKTAEIILKKRSELGKLLCMENGKRISEAEEEFDTVAALIESYTDAASHLYGTSLPNGTDLTSDHRDMIVTRFEPVGVVACLLPFNFPVELCGIRLFRLSRSEIR
jgi:acyl-CoA reductase-like NAD-dependent aldehyde dehydrogenase